MRLEPVPKSLIHPRLQRAVELAPDEATIRNNLGTALETAGLLEEAEAELRRAIELNPALAEARVNLGNVFRKLNKTDDADANYQSAFDHAGDDPDIHLYIDPAEMPVSVDEVVNAVQMASAVLIQKSTREGFGLTVTEGMWKGKPVIGGDAGGIRVQINDGVSGFLVSSPEECAKRLVELLKDEPLAARIGKAARESVRQRFLLPRLALDYLTVAWSRVNGRMPAVSGD